MSDKHAIQLTDLGDEASGGGRDVQNLKLMSGILWGQARDCYWADTVVKSNAVWLITETAELD